MTATHGDAVRPWPKLSPAQRFGPLLAVVALLVGAGVVATVKGGDTVAGSGPGRGPGISTPGGTGGGEGDSDGDGGDPWSSNPDLPIIHAEAQEAGTLDQYDWGDRCDADTGRIMVPSVYAVPCVPAFEGDNGGATTKGVTADEIVVAYYIPGPQDLLGLAESLGVFDSASLRTQLLEELVAMANANYETYGRRVVIKAFQGTGDGKNPAQARADARRVAEDLGAFASIGGPTQSLAYQEELARRGVLCLACSPSAPDSLYQDLAPYSWAVLASPDQILQGVLDFGVANLFGKPAVHAGDPTFRDRTRTIGVVHYDQDPPIYDDLTARMTARYEAMGAEADVIISYLLDTATTAQQAQGIIGRLKEEAITTVVFAGDPFMLMDLVNAAGRQDYHPEWVITGTVFTDTTAVGRLIVDQEQWSHAFGASSSPARGRPEQSDTWRLYAWFHGKDPEAKKSLQLIGPVVQLLFTGVHLAGATLTPETFAGGMFRYPPSGGGPTTPQISYGDHGIFEQLDYVGIDDFTMVWWDPDLVGPSEQQVEGPGMWRYPLGGQRYLMADPQKLDDRLLFQDVPESPGILTEIPETDRVADYPPPPGAPAAGGGG